MVDTFATAHGSCLEEGKMTRSAVGIIAVALIWAAVIWATSMVLDGTPYWGQMLRILGGGAAATIIVLGGTRRAEIKR